MLRFHGWLLAHCLVFFVVISSASCASVQPKKDTPAPTGDAAKFEAEALFTAGITAFNRGEMDTAQDKLDRYMELAPEGPRVPAALLHLGKVALYRRNYDQAETYLKTVQEQYPDSPQAPEAQHLLHVVAGERRKAADSAQVVALEQQRDQAADPEQRAAVTEQLVAAHSEMGQWWQAFTEVLALLNSDQPATRAQAEKDLPAVVDRMSLVELDQAMRETETGTYAQGVVLFRLGALTMHLRDWERARAYFTQLVSENPQHVLTARANMALKRLTQRSTVVPTRIGILLPPSRGRLTLVRQALELAAESAKNESGGALEFVFAETKGDPVTASAAVDDMVMTHHVVAIVGTIIGDVAEAAAYRAEQFDVPLITLSPRENLPQLGPNVFRAALTPQMQAKAIVDYAWDVKGFRNFAILYPMHPYGQMLAFAFWDEVKKRGGRITGVERYRHDETTFRKHVRRLVGRYYLTYSNDNWRDCRAGKTLDCGRVGTGQKEETQPNVDFDAIFIPDYAKQVGMIAPTIPFEEVEIDNGLKSTYGRVARTERRSGHKVGMVHLLGSNGWNSDKLFEIGGKYVTGSLFCDGFFAQSDQPEVMLFVEKFKEKTGYSPAAQEAYAYDAVKLLAHVLLTAHPRDRVQLRLQLLSLATQRYTGVTGPMHFDKDGEMVNELIILTLKSQEIVPANENDDIEDDEPKPQG